MTQVKIDEVLRLVCDIAAEIPAHDTVPGRVIFLVKFLQKEREKWYKLRRAVTPVVPARTFSCSHPPCPVSKLTLPPQPRASEAQVLRLATTLPPSSIINTTKAPLFLAAKPLALYTLIISPSSSYLPHTQTCPPYDS